MATDNETSAAAVAPPPDAFRFGANWNRYVRTFLDPDRERIAADSLADLVGDLQGKRFLDIGCGSGLFSLCAYRAGAGEVWSLDVDPDAVSTTSQLRERAGSPDNWHILHRSILDETLPSSVEPADVVYSWGVLHHTGDMYRALRNAAATVRPGGKLAIAIYNRVTVGHLTSERWWHIKRFYNRAPRPVQLALELTYASYLGAAELRRGENPVRFARRYRQSRGMALWTDIADWLGGYPYEFATAEELVEFCEQACGLRILRVVPVTPRDSGNNQFVFERPIS